MSLRSGEHFTRSSLRVALAAGYVALTAPCTRAPLLTFTDVTEEAGVDFEVHFHFVPTGASRANLVERLFGELDQRRRANMER